MFFILLSVQAGAQKRKNQYVLYHQAVSSKAVAVLQPKLLEVKAAKTYPNDNIHYILRRGTTMIINKMTYETETEWVQFGKA